MISKTRILVKQTHHKAVSAILTSVKNNPERIAPLRHCARCRTVKMRVLPLLFLAIAAVSTAEELVEPLDSDSFDGYMQSHSDVIVELYTPV